MPGRQKTVRNKRYTCNNLAQQVPKSSGVNLFREDVDFHLDHSEATIAVRHQG